MKIFYQPVEDPQKILDEQSYTSEELYLSTSILNQFTAALKESTNLLPMSARSFREWSVGLIDRYQKDSAITEDVDAQFKPLFTSGEPFPEGHTLIKAQQSFDAEFAPLYT